MHPSIYASGASLCSHKTERERNQIMTNDKGDPRLSNITPGHVRAFHALTSGMYDNITLWSCRIDGEPGVAIVMVDHVGEGKAAVMPLFVAITPKMELSFDDEQEGDDSGGGGPRRTASADTLREFEVNKAVLAPGSGT